MGSGGAGIRGRAEKKLCLQSFLVYGIILCKSNRVARWKASLTPQKKGGGADGYIPDFKPAIFGR